MWKFERYIVVGLVVVLFVETACAANDCETKTMELLCAMKVGPNNRVCKVPKVGKIINVTVKQPVGDTVCNQVVFPLETGASQAYAWHGDEVFTTDDCSAVFTVEYEKCKTVTVTRCKESSKRLRCNKGGVCKVPKIDRIINATLIRTIGKTVCNQVTFPLGADAKQAYTWKTDEILTTDDCRAVFNIFYEKCTKAVTHKCKPKSKELRCAKKVVPRISVCKVPKKVGKIINVSIKRAVGDAVCNKAAFPLDTDATQAFTWNKDEVYATNDCWAVFNVEYEKCKTVTVTRCKVTSKRLRCATSTVCIDPKVDRIINATLIRTLRKTVCNKAAFPLETDASQKYTWNGNEIYTTKDCKAVFYIFYEKCKRVVRHRCKPKSKELRCPKNVVHTGRICRVPEVDRIISATVNKTVGETVCNQAPFPLAIDASQAYAWNGDEIFTTNDCKAVFNVEYEKCKTVKGKCYIHGDPHVTDADGLKFTVHGPVPCDYHLVTHRTFNIIGSLTGCFRQNMSCLRRIRIDFKGETVFLGQEGNVTDADGNPFESSKKIEIIDSGNRIEAVLLKGKARGVTVTWNKKTNAEILIPKSLMNKVDGLCGDYDGDPDNNHGARADATPYLVDSSCQASNANAP